MSHVDRLKRQVAELCRELAACRRDRRYAGADAGVTLGKALEAIVDPAFLHDREGRIVHANSAYLRLSGCSLEQVHGLPYWEVLPKGSGPTPGCLRALARPGVQEEELAGTNGEVLRMRSFALADGRDERSSHSLHVLEDITERKRHEEALRRANDELERFAYIASHDLKAPLRAVHGLSSWIEEEVGDQLSEEGKVRMRLLRERVQLMDDLLNAMLDYSRAGSSSAELQDVSVAELVQEVVSLHGLPGGFTVSAASDLPRFRTDRLHLQQVFANLIGNAIDYHDRPDGHVWVSARDLGAFYEFAVTDDGPGIAPTNHDRIFEMFQRGPAKTGGTGIGLAVVRRVIEHLGGRIQLESKLGEGATFRFTWPKVISGEPGHAGGDRPE